MDLTHTSRFHWALVTLGAALLLNVACSERSLNLPEADAYLSEADAGPGSPASGADLTPGPDQLQETKASCEPMLGVGGPCGMVMGYSWDGRGCVVVSGCGCPESGCEHVYRSWLECESVYQHCPKPPLSEGEPCDITDDRCGAGLTCCIMGCGIEPPPDSDDERSCGVPICLAASDGVCPQGEIPSPSQCNCLSVWMPVCGEDGKIYSNDCVAGCAGVTVVAMEECGSGIINGGCVAGQCAWRQGL